MSWNNYISKKRNIEGARAAFEEDIASLFRTIYPDDDVRRVKVKRGDGGVDVFIGNIGVEPITVIQCKFFFYDFGITQRQQIKSSFDTAIMSTEYDLKEWILCVPCVLDMEQNKWWSKWITEQIAKHSLSVDAIQLLDGDALIDLLKKHSLYNQVFEIEEMLKLEAIESKLDTVVAPGLNFSIAQEEIKKASFYLQSVTNFFGEKSDTHIERDETATIYNWINADLPINQKNVFILESEKGFGKTVILKDLLVLLQQENIDVLGIKADKYYASDRLQLEKIIFQKDEIHLEEIAKLYAENKKLLVIIVDQLDALSQTLSSNREYILTYNRLIADLSLFNNIRIVISTRSFDLNYDAEISIYKSAKYAKLKVALIKEDKVKEVLTRYGVPSVSAKLLQLLSVPNHLDIFCKLPNKRILDTLSSVKDLYDALWKQLITETQGLDLKQTLYGIADKMYQEQRIVSVNLFDDKNKEITYLKSNHLIVEDNNELQFFHQTFYDYTFSRQFVENEKSLEKYIHENKQSLYIRAVTKMVVEYYRDYNHKEYIRLLKVLIRASNYRFHLKTLIFNTLGAIKKPTDEECKIAQLYILTNPKYSEVFITSVFSSFWLTFLFKTDWPKQNFLYTKSWKQKLYERMVRNKIIKPQEESKYDFPTERGKKVQLNWQLFVNNVDGNIDNILDYLEIIGEFPDKDNFMSRFLINIDDWESKRLLPLFNTYLAFDESGNRHDNFWFYQILQKIFPHNPQFVFDNIRPIILQCFREQSTIINYPYELGSLLEKINEINPESTFDFIFAIFNEIIEESKHSCSYEQSKSPLYKSFKFSVWDDDSATDHADAFIEKLLTTYLKSKITNPTYLRDFYNKYKNSNSIPLLQLLVVAFTEIPLLYKSEVFELLIILHKKYAFYSDDDTFQFSLRILISKCFGNYTGDEQSKLVEILLSVKHPSDVYYHTDPDLGRKVYLNLYGKKKYLFIDALSKRERDSVPILKKVHQELERKFGKVTKKQLDGNRMSWYTVGAPLDARAYKKMKNKDWKKTIYRYNDDFTINRSSHPSKGGKFEHSRAFEEEVFAEPEKFYSLIVELLDDENVSANYIASGLDGLIKAEFDVDKVKEIFKKHISKNLDTITSLYAVRNIEYFIKHKTVDFDILEYLCNMALHHSNPEKLEIINDSLTDSMNTVRGAAIHKIPFCYYNSDFKEKIFETLEQVIHDKNVSVRVALLANLAFLNYLDLDRSFKLFSTLTDTDDLEILNHSFRAASYFGEKFYDEMKPYYNKIIDNEELHKNGSVLIVHNWILGRDKDKSFYNRLAAKGNVAKLEILRVAEGNIFHKKKIDNKCLDIFFEFLNETHDDFAHSYSGFILRKFKVSQFKQLLLFMKKYAKTELFKKDPRYFLQYLLKCTKEYPIDSLELLKHMDFSRATNIQMRGHYDAEPVQLILAIYSSLNNNFTGNSKQIEHALTIFDNMLTLGHLRISSNKAIETLK